MHKLLLILIFLTLNAPLLQAQWLLEYEQAIPVEEEENTLSSAWAGGLRSGQYFNLDIDRDGQQDLIVFDRTSEQFSPFISQNNNFNYAPEYSLLFPDHISDWVLFADYDGDGRKDLFTASGKRSITVYRNVSNEQLAWELVADPIATLGFSGFQVAIQVNATDVPAISDIDSDGDLDVVVFNVNGRGNLEYYQNMSIEQYGNASTLEFVAAEREWGDVLECDCGVFAFGEVSCAEVGARKVTRQAKTEHIGAKSLLAFDADGDGDKDLLASDEGCGVLYYLENVGTEERARFESLSTNFLEDLPPGLSLAFPAAYHVDATHDGIRDIIVAPNSAAEIITDSDMTNSSWLYENTGTEAQPVFTLQQRDFLQQAMLDVGANASPALADYDADGDLDLFIGQKGSSVDGENYVAGITLYENTGTAANPAFSFRTADYLGLRSLGLQRLSIYFEDLNGDGLLDLLLSGAESLFSSRATFFFLPNQTSSLGDAWSFDPENRQPLSLNFHPEDRLAFFDADRDDDLDVLIGQQEGNLAFFENLASSTSTPEWVLVRENAGGISSSIFRRNLSVLLHDFDGNGQPDLLTTDGSSTMSLRYDFASQLTEPEVAADTAAVFFSARARNLTVGRRTWLAAAKLDNTSKTYILLGSPQGGIRMLSHNPEGEINAAGLLLFPNPVDIFQQRVNIQSTEAIQYLQLIGANGTLIWEREVSGTSRRLSIDTIGLAAGIYLLRAWQESGKVSTAKLMVR